MSTNSLTITWAAPSDPAGPGQESSGWFSTRVYRDGNPIVSPDNPVLAPLTTFVDTSLQPNTTYQYSLCAIDKAGNESPISSPTVPGTTQGTGPLPPNKIVQPNGSPTNPGTAQVYTSLRTALLNIAASDRIELRSNTAGGQTNNTELLEITGKNFSAATKALVYVRDGDKWQLRGSGANSPILMIDNSSHIELAGDSTGRLGLEISNPATWNPVTTDGMIGPHNMTVRGHNSHHITFRNCTLHGNGINSKGIFVRRDCAKWVFDDCELSKHGSVNNDVGDLIDIYSTRSILNNCYLAFGGHDSLSATCPYLVVRNCVIYGKWEDVSSTFANLGARLGGFTPSQHDNWSPTPGAGGNFHRDVITTNEFEFGPQLVEGCSFGPSFNGTVGGNDPATKLQGFRVTERGNIWFDTVDNVWVGPTYQTGATYLGTPPHPPDGKYPGPGQAKCYVYHNTTYNTGGLWNNNGSAWYSALHQNTEMEQFRFRNNVFAQLHDAPTAGRSVVYWRLGDVPQTANWPNAWKGTSWLYNIFQGNAVRMNFELNDTERAVGSPGDWSTIVGNVEVASLTFSNASLRTIAGLTLTGGTGYQDAPALTLTTSGGTNTKTLPVTDAGYFYDGENPATWNMADLGERNDYVAVGPSRTNVQIAQIESINAAFTTITLKTAISFGDGDGVWFAGNPANGTAKIWDNRGAGQ